MSSAGDQGGRHERWLSVLLSILVHGGIVAVVGWGWWRFSAPKRLPQQLAIEATVVVDRPVAVTPAPAAAVEPAAPPDLVAPTPATAPARPAAEERVAPQERATQQEQAANERQKLADRQRERRAQEQARRAQELQEAAARNAKEAADRLARDKAQRAAQDKARRETELRTQLAAEERVNAARGSAAEAAWLALIRDHVTRAWIRPPSARAGVNCEVHVVEVPGGAVTGVQIGNCNGDQAVRESIEAAVYRASPLPTPSNADVFDRNLRFNFHPDE